MAEVTVQLSVDGENRYRRTLMDVDQDQAEEIADVWQGLLEAASDMGRVEADLALRDAE